MKILLTGANGFVGSHILEELVENNHEVTVIIRKSSNLQWIKSCNANFLYGSLDDINFLNSVVKDVDVVVHCAGAVRALNWDLYEKVNVIGTRNIVHAVLKNNTNLKKFIFISSQAAMGPSLPGTTRKVSDQENPVSDYGKSKLLAEAEVKKLKDKIPFTILRPASVYGPRDKDIFTFFKLVRYHIAPKTKNKHIIQLVFVKDIAKIVNKILDIKQAENKTYYLADGGVYSWKDVADIIAKANGIKTVSVTLFDFIFKTAGFIGNAVEKVLQKPQVLSSQKITEMLQTCWTAESSMIRSDTGFEFTKLENGAKITYNWYLDNKYF